MHRSLSWSAGTAGVALLALAGCAQSNLVVPVPGAGAPTDALLAAGIVARPGGIVESAIGRGLLTIDPVTVTATWEPLPLRAAQDNDSVYALAVNDFLKPVDFQIKAVRRTPGGYELDYEFAHPFKSSEVSNRADLGFSGMLMMGVLPPGVTSYTWFKDDPSELITDPRWITNADGYYKPGGLVDTGGFSVNAFPYQLLIDEQGQGNRKDAVTGAAISNGGFPTGNFVAPSGWQTGASKDWTGYGVIHQGQMIRNTIMIDGAQLASAGSFPVITVLVAKYADPKSATPGFEHRLPVDPPDVVGEFGYRMPHGAFDVIQAEFLDADSGWIPNVESTNGLRFHVVDWDARATETTMASLKEDPDATHVAQGEAGLPELALCIPGILGDRTTIAVLGGDPTDDDSAYGGDVGPDSGAQGDPLFYAFVVPKPAGSDQEDGEVLGWLRVTDVEVDTQSEYTTALNPDLTPITGEFPLPMTFHPFMVYLGADCAPSSGVGWATTFGDRLNPELDLFGIAVDSAGSTYSFGSFLSKINLGGGDRTSAGQDDLFLVKHDINGDYVWDKTFGVNRSEKGRAIAVDSQDRIWIGGAHPAAFDLGGGPLTPPMGVTSSMYLGRFNTAGDHQFSATYATSGFAWLTDLAIGPADEVYLTGYIDGTVDFGDGVLTTAGSEDIAVAAFGGNGTAIWSTLIGGTLADRGFGIATDPGGNAYVTGSYSDMVDFGVGGTKTSLGDTDAYLLKLAAADGAPQWVGTFGNTDTDQGWRVGTDAMNHVVVCGRFENSIDLGGGAHMTNGTGAGVFLGSFATANGAYGWSKGLAESQGNIGLELSDVIVSDGGQIVLSGAFFSSLSFGGPDRFANDGTDGYLVSYDQAGAWQWDGQLAAEKGNKVTTLTWTPAGHLAYAGYFNGITDLDPSCGIVDTAGTSSIDLFVARARANGRW